MPFSTGTSLRSFVESRNRRVLEQQRGPRFVSPDAASADGRRAGSPSASEVSEMTEVVSGSVRRLFILGLDDPDSTTLWVP